MWKHALILLISAALLVVSGAEAMSGHCAKTADPHPAEMMSDHCTEMRGMDRPVDPGSDTDESDAICCCVITSAPVMLSAPLVGDVILAHAVWQRPADTTIMSVPLKVAIPPPRV